MLTAIVVIIGLYLLYRLLRWMFTSSKGSSRSRSGGGFFDDLGDFCGGDGDGGD